MVKVERKHPYSIYVNRSGAGLDWKIQIHPLKEGVYVTSIVREAIADQVGLIFALCHCNTREG